MSELGEQQRRELADYFFSRARGEWTTALAFEHIMSDLQHVDGSNDFIQRVQSAREDERRHAETCMDFVRLYSFEEAPELTPRGTRPLAFPEALPEDQRLLRLVFACCFSESIAVQWLLEVQKECSDPKSRKYNRDHLADEVRHSRLGWQFLASDLISRRDKQMLARYVPLMVEWSRRLWSAESEENDPTLAIYGCPAPQSTAEAVESALDGVILPGLELNGVRVSC